MKRITNLHWRRGEIYPVWTVLIVIGISIAIAVAIWVLNYQGYF